MNLWPVFYQSVLPIFLLIGVGVLLDRAFRLDLSTLSRLNFYVFVPALVFVSLLEAELPGGEMLRVAAFAVVHLLLLYLVCVSLFWKWFASSRTVLTLSVLFFNCGNYGFPLVALAFGREYWGVAAVVLMVQNLLSFTFGIWLLEKEHRKLGQVLLGMLKIPVVWAVAVPFALRWFEVTLPPPVAKSFGYLADGLIPVALLTLGAQLSRSFGLRNLAPITVVGVLRLAAAPALAWVLLWLPLFGLDGATERVLLVLMGLPVAVNVYILAAEYRRDEALASQAVFWTTLASAATVSVLLALWG